MKRRDFFKKSVLTGALAASVPLSAVTAAIPLPKPIEALNVPSLPPLTPEEIIKIWRETGIVFWRTNALTNELPNL